MDNLGGVSCKPRETTLSPPVFFTDHSKAVLLLWIVFVSYASCWCMLCCGVCSL